MKHLILIALLLGTIHAKPAPKLSKEDKLINDILTLKTGAVAVRIEVYTKLDRFRINVTFQWVGKAIKRMPTDKNIKKLLKQARKDGFTIVKYSHVSGILGITINKAPKKVEVNLD